MLETTPGYNPTHNSPHQTSAGVDLAPVVINPSQLLWRIEVFIYSLMLVSASIAILPFLFTAFYWPLLLLIFLMLILVALRSRFRSKKRPPCTLSVAQQIWRLQNFEGEYIVKPCDEILIWNGVIILPLRETLSGRKHQIIALIDSMDAEDWRRLRVWLRMGLRKNI